MSGIQEFLDKKGSSSWEGHSGQNKHETLFLKNICNIVQPASILEIGFNSGHSSDTFLSHSDSKILSFDIGLHGCVWDGKEYIDNTYEGRHHLIIGDSTETVPKFKKEHSDVYFDLIFIDGGHEYEVALNDLINCMNLSRKDTTVIMDDVIPNSRKDYAQGPTKAWIKSCQDKMVFQEGMTVIGDEKGWCWGKYNLL